MLINKIDILEVIPQRAPFVMIDSLIEASSNGFTSVFTINEKNIFLEGGQLSEMACVENIAQTCAAGFGYLARNNSEETGKLGFIGAISKLEVFAHCKEHDILETEVRILNSFANVHLIEGWVRCQGADLLKCQMKIVQA